MQCFRKVFCTILASAINIVAFLLTLAWIQLTWTSFLATAALLRYEYLVYYTRTTTPPALVPKDLSTVQKVASFVVLFGPLLALGYYTRKDRDRRWFRVLKSLLVMQPTLLLVVGAIVMVEVRYNPWAEKARKVWAALGE